MNSTKALSDKNRYSCKPFFGFTLRNNWQHFALYFIIMLLAIVLPCVMMMNEYMGSGGRFYDWNAIRSNMVAVCGITGILSSLAVAVFSGMSAASYVNSKQMVGCYHSFPIRREGMFLIETSVRVIYYLAAFLPCTLLSMLMLNVSYGLTAEMNLAYLQYVLSAILCYLLLYSILLFAGGLTGTAPVRLIMALLILYLPLALYALVLVGATIGIPRLISDYYLSQSVLRVICSTYRCGEAIAYISDTWQPELFLNIFWCIPEAAVYFTGALFLHKYRKSESSGTTIIWKPVFLITKYVTVFTAALLGIGLFGSNFFGISSGNAAWIIFGLIFGLVISFMVVNAILYRSSKAIFKGLRGLAAIAVLSAVFMIILPMDAFGLNEKIYGANNTKSLELDGIVFEDAEKIETLVALMEQEGISAEAEYYDEYEPVYLWNESNSEELTEEFHYTVFTSAEEAAAAVNDYTKANYNFNFSSMTYIDMIQHPKFGIPLAKRVYIDRNGALWDTVARSAEFDEIAERISKVDGADLTGVEIILANFAEYIDFNSNDEYILTYPAETAVAVSDGGGAELNYKGDYTRIRAITAEILPYCLYDAESRDNGTIIGTISVNVARDSTSAELLNETYVTYPVYAENLEVVNGICRIINELYSNSPDYKPYPDEFRSAEDYFEYFVDTYMAAVAIIDSETGEIRSMPVGEFRNIAGRTAALRNRSYYSTNSYIKVFDSRYWVVGAFNVIDDPEYNDTRTLYFRDGAITDAELAELFELSK